jgi:hypothetical protein
MNKEQENKEIELADNVEAIDEASTAANTLKPGAMTAADPKSRIEMIGAVLGALGQMPKRDFVKWFDQVMSQYGPNREYGVGDNSARNKASVAMKSSLKEDFEVMFDGQDLSEEFKEKATTIFEAAISSAVIVETARLEEEFEQKLVEQASEIEEMIASKLDTYLDYVVESWMKENEVAIESTLRNEIMEEFIDSLKNVFEEHYIEVPAEKTDVLESLALRVQELEEKLDEVITENSELRTNVVGHEMNDVFESLCSDLALTQIEKFRALSEGIEFDGDLDTYSKKLAIIKESYFKSTEKASTQTVIDEEFEEHEASTDVVYTDPRVKSYVQAISRTIKR